MIHRHRIAPPHPVKPQPVQRGHDDITKRGQPRGTRRPQHLVQEARQIGAVLAVEVKFGRGQFGVGQRRRPQVDPQAQVVGIKDLLGEARAQEPLQPGQRRGACGGNLPFRRRPQAARGQPAGFAKNLVHPAEIVRDMAKRHAGFRGHLAGSQAGVALALQDRGRGPDDGRAPPHPRLGPPAAAAVCLCHAASSQRDPHRTPMCRLRASSGQSVRRMEMTR